MSTLSATLIAFAITVVELLPESPFVALEELAIAEAYQWLKWVNWFIPINSFIAILEAWLVAVGIYYGVQIVLRWVKVIE